jgi:peptidoglycan/xylan/chitin deacetylase (PgdA/CDA1 family)
MNYSKDIQRRRRWFRINYALIVSAIFLSVVGLLLADWNPVPAAKYASHDIDYLRVQQKLLAQPNLLSNVLWVRSGSPEATVSLNDSQMIGGTRAYRLTAQLPQPNLTASVATSPITVTPSTAYVYDDTYLATVENQLEVEEFNAKQQSVARQFLSRYPASTVSTPYAAHFVTGPETTTVVIRRYVDQSGKLTIENQHLRQTPIAGFTEGMISIVFDDSQAGAFKNAVPILRTNDFKATFYAVANNVDKPGYMTTDELIDLFDSGNEIGSNSVTNRDLLGITSQEKDAEISRSRQMLAALGLGEVEHFAAPFGKNDAETRTLARRYYRSQRNLEDQTVNYPYTYDPFSIKAFVVDAKTDPAKIASLVDQTKKTGGWLVLVYHDVAQEDDWVYRISTEAFTNHMNSIRDSGVAVRTMTDALNTVDAYFRSQP